MNIYFYYLPENNLVKIGCSTNIEQRIKNLSTGCIEVGQIIRVISGYGFQAEKWLHKYFKDLRVKGEWFKYTEEMLTVNIPDEASDMYHHFLKFPLSSGVHPLPNGGVVPLKNFETQEDQAKALTSIYRTWGLSIK